MEVRLQQGGEQQEPQMVSLPSCCSSNIPCPTAQPACANYLSLEYAFMHICCLRGLLVCKFLLGNYTLWCLNTYFCFVFWHCKHILFINNCLLNWVAVMIYSQLCVLQNRIWNSLSMWLMIAGVSTLLIRSYFRDWNKHVSTDKVFLFMLFELSAFCEAM